MTDLELAPDAPAHSLEEELDRAAALLASAATVALACHVNPDPDAAGSMLGLGRYLADRGASVVCSWGNDPMEMPRWLPALGGESLLVGPSEFPSAPEVMVALDTASLDRLGVLAANVERAREVVLIDHHATNAGFGTVHLLDPLASSTCELVFRLIERMGGGMSDGVAAALYAGLITDTGRFQYQATTPDTLRVAAALREHRFDHSRIAQDLFEQNAFRALKLTAVALDRASLEPESDLVWTYLTQRDLATSETAPSELDDLIDVVRTAREADVAAVVRQQRDGRFKVSLRSRGATDVGGIAHRFGGGGHRLAAGYTASGGVEQVLSALRSALADLRGHSDDG